MLLIVCKNKRDILTNKNSERRMTAILLGLALAGTGFLLTHVRDLSREIENLRTNLTLDHNIMLRLILLHLSVYQSTEFPPLLHVQDVRLCKMLPSVLIQLRF